MCDYGTFGGLQVHMLCVMMIRLEGLEVHTLGDDDRFGGSRVHALCVMMIHLEVWRFIHFV